LFTAVISLNKTGCLISPQLPLQSSPPIQIAALSFIFAQDPNSSKLISKQPRFSCLAFVCSTSLITRNFLMLFYHKKATLKDNLLRLILHFLGIFRYGALGHELYLIYSQPTSTLKIPLKWIIPLSVEA